MSRGVRWPIFAALLIGACALAACGGGKNTSDDPLTIGGMAETVTMKDTAFSPGNLQIPVGATVTWLNLDGALHDAKADGGDWETENLKKDESDSVVFDEPGEYSYYCSLHPSMKARVTVVRE